MIIRRLRAFYHYRKAMWERYLGVRSHDRRTFKSSEHHFTRAIALRPAYRDAMIERGILRWREMDNFQGAIVDFTQALSLEPSDQNVLLCRSMAYYRGGHYLAAIADLEKVIDIDPQSRFARDAHLQLGSLYAIASDLPQASRKLSSSQNKQLNAGTKSLNSGQDD